MSSTNEFNLTGSSDDWSCRTDRDIPFLSLDSLDTTYTENNIISDTPNIPTRTGKNQRTLGFENDEYEFDENNDLCYISSIVEVLGDGMKRLADTIMKQYSKITSDSESNCPESNSNTQENDLLGNTPMSATQSNAATSTSALQSKLLNKGLHHENEENSTPTENLKEKLSELEEISIRHSILLNDSYKSHWLLIRKVRAIQNDMKKIEKILLRIQSNQAKINLNANDIKNNLNVIKNNQQEIKINFENIKSSQELIKKAQKNILQTQFLLSKKAHASISANEMTTNTSENSSQNLNHATSKPNLSFYTFNCALPNGMQLFDVSPDLLGRIINSKESFKSTLDYVYTQDLENSGNKPSLCGLLGVYECTPNSIDSSDADENIKSGEFLHDDLLEKVGKSNEESHLHSNQNNEDSKFIEVNLNNNNEDIENASKTLTKEGLLLVQLTSSNNEEEHTSECCSDGSDCNSSNQAEDGGETKRDS